MEEIKFSLRKEEKDILRLINNNLKGLYIKEIAKKMDINEITASKRIEILARAGLIEERRIGKVKLFYPKNV